MSRVITTALGVLCCTGCLAGASAMLEDTCCGDSTVWQRVTVFITPDSQDQGLPGAFYIAVLRNQQEAATFNGKEWVSWQGGHPDPADYFTQLPSTTSSYVVLDQQMVCNLVGNANAELWAGYGVLRPDKELIVQRYSEHPSQKIPPNHIRNVYVQYDMKDRKTYWNVLNMNCAWSE